MEADDWRSQVKHELKLLVAKTRKWIAWIWHGTQVELIVVRSEALLHATCRICVYARRGVREEINVERPVGNATYLFLI
jgi:hypothetical protein